MKFFPLLQQLLPVFFMVGVWSGSIHSANCRTLWILMGTYAFGASFRVNDADGLTLTYGLVGAFRLTGSTTDTCVSDFVCHFLI